MIASIRPQPKLRLCPRLCGFYPHCRPKPNTLAAISAGLEPLQKIRKVNKSLVTLKDGTHFNVACKQSALSPVLRDFFSQFCCEPILFVQTMAKPSRGK